MWNSPDSRREQRLEHPRRRRRPVKQQEWSGASSGPALPGRRWRVRRNPRRADKKFGYFHGMFPFFGLENREVETMPAFTENRPASCWGDSFPWPMRIRNPPPGKRGGRGAFFAGTAGASRASFTFDWERFRGIGGNRSDGGGADFQHSSIHRPGLTLWASRRSTCPMMSRRPALAAARELLRRCAGFPSGRRRAEQAGESKRHIIRGNDHVEGPPAS